MASVWWSSHGRLFELQLTSHSRVNSSHNRLLLSKVNSTLNSQPNRLNHKNHKRKELLYDRLRLTSVTNPATSWNQLVFVDRFVSTSPLTRPARRTFPVTLQPSLHHPVVPCYPPPCAANGCRCLRLEILTEAARVERPCKSQYGSISRLDAAGLSIYTRCKTCKVRINIGMDSACWLNMKTWKWLVYLPNC